MSEATLTQRARHQLGTVDSRVWIALAVNIVLIAAYVWSRGGQTVTVRIEARGDEVVAYVDGREFGRVDAPATSGGPVIRLADPSDIWLPARPEPRGLRAVEVTSLVTGETLYSWRPGDPVPGADESQLAQAIDLSQETWQDYAVEVRLNNPVSAGLSVRAGGAGGPLFGFNRFDSPLIFLRYAADGAEPKVVGTARLEFDQSEGVRALVAMAVRPYPFVLAAIALLLLTVVGVEWATRRLANFPEDSLPTYVPFAIAGALALTFLVCATFIFSRYGQRLPHVVDETAYLFQARLLASGRTHVDTPAIPEAFQFAASPFIVDYEGRWASFYPFGQPIVLAAGELLGIAWLIPPLIGALSVFLVFLLGRGLYNAWSGLVAASLMAFSPFVLMQASSYMSHTTASVYLLAALCAWFLPRGHGVAWAAVAGLALGLLFNTRPLTAVLLVPWFALLVAADLLRAEDRRRALMRAATFVAGGSIMVAMYYGYNLAVAGSFDNGYGTTDGGSVLGFGGAHSVAQGLENQHILLATLIAVIYGVPAFVGLAPVLLPFILGTRRFIDWWLLGASITVMAGWMLYEYAGIYFGPRYWYEIVPLLMLLSGRGVFLLAERAGLLASSLRDVSKQRAHAISLTIVTAGVVLMVGFGAYSWLLAGRPAWRFPTAPAEPREMRFAFDDRLKREIEGLDLHNALVLVRPCGETRLCYQSVFLMNATDLHGDIVVANDLGPRNPELFASYPCRSLYFATYQPPSVVAQGSTPPPPGSSCE